MKSTAAASLAATVRAAAAAPKPDTGPDLALVRRILRARDPAALAELDAGLVEAAKGEPALAAWLARPLARRDPRDPLDAVSDALSAATAFVEQLSPNDRRAATLLNSASNLAKTAEAIAAKRPRAETADEVTERIRTARDAALRKIVEHTGEARAKLEADREDLLAWAAGNLGPLIAAELERRLGLMLGEEPAS